MCTTCGCEQPNTAHHHDHEHHSQPTRIIDLEQNVLSKNNRYAEQNRARFADQKIRVFNLVSSPGSGKTSLLTRTIESLSGQRDIAVIEGDQQTENDAERIRAAGAQAVQINTGKGCHLDAHGIGHAVDELMPSPNSLLFIENVGNLVCPAAFDLGEQAKVLVLSVTEGEDKPLKYPDMFRASQLMIINKIDLLPYVDFDLAKSIDYARRINPDIQVIQLSAKTGEGMEQWLEWLSNT